MLHNKIQVLYHDSCTIKLLALSITIRFFSYIVFIIFMELHLVTPGLTFSLNLLLLQQTECTVNTPQMACSRYRHAVAGVLLYEKHTLHFGYVTLIISSI